MSRRYLDNFDDVQGSPLAFAGGTGHSDGMLTLILVKAGLRPPPLAGVAYLRHFRFSLLASIRNGDERVRRQPGKRHRFQRRMDTKLRHKILQVSPHRVSG